MITQYLQSIGDNAGLSDGVKMGAIHNPHTGCFFHWYPSKKLKYGKPRLGESTLT